MAEPAELLIETPDADEIGTSLVVPINLAGTAQRTVIPAADLGAIGYVRPAGSSSEVTVTVRTKSGTPLSAVPCATASAGIP